MRRWHMNQAGAASMMSVAIFAIIVTVVVTAYLRAAINQQSEANTYDFSTRAYYAAESGVQDAIRAVNKDPNFSLDECNMSGSSTPNGGILSDSLDIKYTCQLVNKNPDSISFRVTEGSNVMTRLLPAESISGSYEVVVRWSKKGEGQQSYVARTEENAHFPSQSNWVGEDGTTPIHPALRANFVISESANASNIRQRVVFLNPLNENVSVAGQGGVMLDAADNESAEQEKMVRHARCYDSLDTGGDFGEYLCEQVITIMNYPLDTNSLFARIRSLYGATDVQLSLRKDGNTIPVTGSVVEIDVTGSVGNTFRRVRQQYALQNGVIYDTLPDAAVIGGEGICKYYSITDQVDGFDSNNNVCEL